MDTLEFGIAPYAHDIGHAGDLVRRFRHALLGKRRQLHMSGDQLSFLLRFFKKRTWIEAGATTDGKLQARAMFSL